MIARERRNNAVTGDTPATPAAPLSSQENFRECLGLLRRQNLKEVRRASEKRYVDKTSPSIRKRMIRCRDENSD
jgi:hypothetical protein